MADATEDRFDVFTRQLRMSIHHDIPTDDSTDTFYESTLAQVSDSYTALPVDHTDGEDDSGLKILAVLGHQRLPDGNLQFAMSAVCRWRCERGMGQQRVLRLCEAGSQRR